MYVQLTKLRNACIYVTLMQNPSEKHEKQSGISLIKHVEKSLTALSECSHIGTKMAENN